MPRHWQMLQVQQKFDWHDAVVFFILCGWTDCGSANYADRTCFFTLHGWTDCGFSHYVVELTSFWHTLCWNWPCGFCTLCVCGFAKNASWLNCLVLHILVGPNWFFMLYGWIPSLTEQENKRTCCIGGFQQWRSRRTREHAVQVDSNNDGAGELESTLYGWISTSPEQENKRACCMGGFQHRRSRRTRACCMAGFQHWWSRRAREPACIMAAAGALVF